MIEISEVFPQPIHLCRREHQVARMILQGLMQKEIAADLGINIKTAEKYVQALYFKFKVNSRVAFVRATLRTKYITLEEFLSYTHGENANHEPPQRYERVKLTPQLFQ